MPVPEGSSRPPRPPVTAWVAAALGTVLLILGLSNLASARKLQARLDHHFALVQAQQALRAPLEQGAAERRLRETVDELLRRPDTGFRYLAVRNPEGILLLRAGALESIRLRWLPAQLSQSLRRLLYRVTASFNQGRIADDSGRLLGTVEYAVADGSVLAARDEAVGRLRLSAWVASLIGLALLGFGLGSLRGRARAVRPLPDWAARLQPEKTSSVGSSIPPESMQQLLHTLRQRAIGALDAMQYAAISADREGRVRFLNTTAERLTGWSAADAQGRLVYSVFHPLDAADTPLVTAAEACLREGRDQAPVECRLRARDGTLHPIEMMACLLRDADGPPDSVVMVFRDLSERVRAIDELKRQSRLSLAVVDHLDEGVLMSDPAGVVRFANARAQRMFGYAREELEGFTVTKLMPVPFLNTPGVRLGDYVAARGSGKLPKVVGWRKDATTFPVELWVQPMKVDGADGLVVIVRDISERLRGENLATRLGRLLDSALEEVYIFDAQSLYFLEINRGARRNLGYRPEVLSRMTPLDISGELEAETFQTYLSRLRGGEIDHLTYRCTHRRQDGSQYPVEVRLNFSREEEPPVFMAIAVDISERQAAEERLTYLAHHDALTGLPNRATLYDRLRQAILTSSRSARMVGVFFVDMDRFKQVNDRFGHEIGDRVLKAAAGRLQGCLREADTVARLGGDEFVVLAQGLRGPEDAEQLGDKILNSFREPLDPAGGGLVVTPSIGMTVHPLDEGDAETLVHHADQAMYHAKEEGRARCCMFDVEVDPQRKRRIELEREIHAAVALSQYQLLLSPVLGADDAVRAVVAGFCWQHPRFGRIEAAEALHAAQRAGLLADLELWLVCELCEQFAMAGKRGMPLVPAIVEISAWQMRDQDFVRHVMTLIERHKVPPRMLVLALSQDGLEELRGAFVTGLRVLQQQGLRFALNGFAGGFDQLNRDAGLSLELVLLAPASAASLTAGSEGRPALQRVIETALAQRRRVIATGISDQATRKAAHEIGCVGVSGPLLPGPMTAKECAAWLPQQRVGPL